MKGKERHSSSSSESASSPSSNDHSSSTVATPAATRASGRRGHSKSRLGCLNCKRRRVKCNELRPTCSPCRRLGLLCDYAITPATAVRSNPSPICLEDLRFYYQFLNTAFPSLPLRADQVWAKCAAMSHQVSELNGVRASHYMRPGGAISKSH